MQEIYVGA